MDASRRGYHVPSSQLLLRGWGQRDPRSEPHVQRVLIEQVRMGIYEHRCCALASRLLVDLAARHPRRRDVHARPGKDRRRTRGTRARKMDTGKLGGRTPVSRGGRGRGPEMRPAGAALPFALSHLCRAALQTECPGEASVPGDRDDGQSERGSTNGKRTQEHPELARGVAASRGGASVPATTGPSGPRKQWASHVFE